MAWFGGSQQPDDPDALRDLKSIFEKISEMKDDALMQPTEEDSDEAMDWYEEFAIQAYEDITKSSQLDRKTKKTILLNSIPDYVAHTKRSGSLYTFAYEAESDRIQYWDRFPLVLRMLDNLNSTETFLGINLHYIEPRFRRILMLNMMQRLMGNLQNPDSRILSLNMPLLMKPINKYARVCIRRYKYDNIRGKILRIPPEHWLKMIYLPTYQFIGGKPAKIWRDSFRKTRKLKFGSP